MTLLMAVMSKCLQGDLCTRFVLIIYVLLMQITSNMSRLEGSHITFFYLVTVDQYCLYDQSTCLSIPTMHGKQKIIQMSISK